MEEDQPSIQSQVTQTIQPIQRSGNNKILYSIIAVLIVIVCGLGGYIFLYSQKKQNIIQLPVINQQAQLVPTLQEILPTIQPTSFPITDLEIYTDEYYAFKIGVPKGWYQYQTIGQKQDKIFPGDTFTMSNYDFNNSTIFDGDGNLLNTIQNPIKIEVIISTDNKQTLEEEEENEWNKAIGIDERGVIRNKITSVNDIYLAEKPAIEVLHSTNSRYDVIVIGNNNYKYHIGFYDFNQKLTEEDNLLLKQILSSFQITVN